jgi:hypothetical protein
MIDTVTKSQNGIRAVVSEAELSALIKLSGITVQKTSPLGQIKTGPAANVSDLSKTGLQKAGLLDGSGHAAPECQECLKILANPGAEIDLLWGTPDSVSLSQVYSSGSKDRLVSYTRSSGTIHLAYFLSAQDIIDLVISKTAFPEIKNEAGLHIENHENTLWAALGVLDLYREAQLKAVLERRAAPDCITTEEEIARLLETSKMEPNFNWYLPAGIIAFPDQIKSGSLAGDGLKRLISSGVIGPDGRPDASLTAFASRAFPLLSFVSVRAVKANNGGLEKVQFALLRGLSTLLLVQFSAENGENRVSIDSISTSRLPELLFNLATQPFEAVAAPAPAKPAAAAKAGNAVCAQPVIKFCPKCGDPVQNGEKFCDKCGTSLT